MASYDRAIWFPNGLDWVTLPQEIYTATGYFAEVTNTDPVIITTGAESTDVETVINNHNPQPVVNTVAFATLDDVKFIANTNNLNLIFPAVTAATLITVTTAYRAELLPLETAVRRHVDPYYYLQFPISSIADDVDLFILEDDLNGLASFVRVEIDGTDVLVYTNVLVVDNSVSDIIAAYTNPASEIAPTEFVYRYTETELGYDPTIINHPQLSTEIDAVLPAPTDLRIGSTPEDSYLDVVFDQSITKATLDPIVTNHVPEAQPVLVNLEKYATSDVVQVQNLDIKLYGSQVNEIIIDKAGQGDFTTIKDAITYYNNSGSTDGAVFILRPGTYIEDNPLTLPDKCNLAAKGIPGNTKVVAMNNSDILFILGKWTEVYNVNTIGPTSSIAFQFACSPATGSFGSIQECVIYNADIGVDVYGDTTASRDALLMNHVLIHAASQNGTTAINIYDGGFVIANTFTITGTPGMFTWNTGISCVGSNNSSMTAVIMTCQFCVKGVVINGGFYQNVTSAIQYNGVGLEMGPNADGKAIIANCRLENNTTYDLNILNASTDIQIVSIFLEQDKINLPVDYALNMDQFTYRKGMTYEYMTGNIAVGSHIIPSTFYSGSGDTNTVDETLLLDDTVTIAAVNPDDDIAVQTGWVLYIGRSTAINTIYLDTDATYTIQTWDSSSWTVIQYSTADKHILIKPTSNMTTVDGNNLHWVRIVFTSNGTVGSARFSGDSTYISKSGALYMLGNARVIRHISNSISDWALGGGAALSVLGFTLGINIGLLGYVIWNGVTPRDRDQSYPIVINVTHAGTVSFDVAWGYLSDTGTKVSDITYNSTSSFSAEIMPDNGNIWIRLDTLLAATIYTITIDYYAYKLGTQVS